MEDMVAMSELSEQMSDDDYTLQEHLVTGHYYTALVYLQTLCRQAVLLAMKNQMTQLTP